MDTERPASVFEPTIGAAQSEPDFSLVLGGPLFQLLRRAHLSDDALALLRKRVGVFVLITWLPLLVISLLEGKATKGAVAVPFVLDLELHVRFLVTLPLLVMAEIVVHRRMRPVVQLFRERNLVAEAELPRFHSIIDSAFRLRNSVVAEVLLLAIVYGVGIQLFWRHYIALNTETWYAMPGAGSPVLSVAGFWYGYVSLPIFQFLLCRWYFRVFIWARFLYQVSRLELRLVPTHPDRLGGLGFLAYTVYAFAPLAAAHGAMLAGFFANRIFHMSAKVSEFRMEAFALVALVLCMVFGPLLVFVPRLSEARRRGLREYGTLAERYSRAFDEKWVRGGALPDEPLLGSGDIQSLADLGNSLEVIRSMRTIPVTKEALFQLGMVTFAPMLPLLLTAMPLEELLKRLFGLLF
ncbi:MAG TPA: hypothetical protein VFF02_11520 [Anaeromyxobacteraceae bacterium]|nr:hypothetical protein [Anaeromyxobacteraceae bacterium]